MKNTFKKKRKPYARRKSDLDKLLDPKKIGQFAAAIGPLVKAIRGESDVMQFVADGDDKFYLYDFEQDASNVFAITANGFESDGQLLQPGVITEQPLANAQPRVVVKPIDILHELERVPKNIVDGPDLDALIQIFEYKEKLIRNNRWSKREVISMLTRLRNRKRYVEFEKFFGAFEHTTSGAIDALLNKYKLVLRPSDLFIPDFPKEAIDIMHQYEATCLQLCSLKPVFYVIAEKSDFKAKDKKRDPILLAQSPFGVYYDILGAWDKEMLLLSEL